MSKYFLTVIRAIVAYLFAACRFEDSQGAKLIIIRKYDAVAGRTMTEKKITFRLNMDKYSHRLAYDIYMSIPGSQRSDYIRLAMILMHDRDEIASPNIAPRMLGFVIPEDYKGKALPLWRLHQELGQS